ncbi:MAG TPA: rhamnogalacturonan acetylesterase [Opitutaceae bacterium]|nr:rhamnogalacturonan acetylesterase [Opitutaceae bacterium]
MRLRRHLRRAEACLAGCALAAAAVAAAEKTDLRFFFGPRAVPGFVHVTPDSAYTNERGFGFDLGSEVQVVDRGGADPRMAGFVTGRGGKPFFFSVKLRPGAYRVTVTLGDAAGQSTTTVKSETRRLMLEAVPTAAGDFATRTFLVHLRVPQLPDGTMVKLKPRERDPILYVQWDENTRLRFRELDWDEKLTLELSDARPALSAIEIAPADASVTVYLIGDSTVTDQMMEPWGAWGQMLPRWFAPPVLIANYAESGETTASFLAELRWSKVLNELHPGDYVLMQFGINDQRLPLEQFRQIFVQFIKDTRQRGATPVLVTSQNLRRLDEHGRAVQTLRGYPDAMREIAREQDVALIDLNAMSMVFYEALGLEKLPRAFVDGTHQNSYGAYELAKCVVQGIVDGRLPFAKYLVADWRPFDPARPDPLEGFRLPADPQLDPARPGGPGAPDGRGPMGADRSPRSAPATPPPAPPAGR